MPVFLDRVRRDNTLASEERFTGHRFEALLRLYVRGHLTRSQMIGFFNLPDDMLADFDKLKDKYDSFAADEVTKINWTLNLMDCVIALQFGDLTNAQFNSILGLTLAEV